MFYLVVKSAKTHLMVRNPTAHSLHSSWWLLFLSPQALLAILSYWIAPKEWVCFLLFFLLFCLLVLLVFKLARQVLYHLSQVPISVLFIINHMRKCYPWSSSFYISTVSIRPINYPPLMILPNSTVWCLQTSTDQTFSKLSYINT
jgi:hypothetical protein